MYVIKISTFLMRAEICLREFTFVVVVVAVCECSSTLFQLDVVFFPLIIVVPSSSSSHSTSSSHVYPVPIERYKKNKRFGTHKGFSILHFHEYDLFTFSFFSNFVKRHAYLNRQKSTICHLKIYVSFRN